MLFLRPACKTALWGGERLKQRYHIASSCAPLAEAWVFSCHPDGPSVIADGPYAGWTLPRYLAAHPECLGSRCAGLADFPFLIKLIDAAQDLSIQVHPDDEYALAHEGCCGKAELWLVLEAEPGAALLYGLAHPMTRQALARHFDEGTIAGQLRSVPVHPGNVFFLPPGTLHAIGRGILLAEVQQNCNVTYRVDDYGRLGPDGVPRPLHREQAAAVACLSPTPPLAFGPHLGQCRAFTADLLQGSGTVYAEGTSFLSLVVLAGSGTIARGRTVRALRPGDSLFLPAGSGRYMLCGPSLRLLCTHV